MPEILTPGGICGGGGGSIVTGGVVVVTPVVVCRSPSGPFAASTVALRTPASAHRSRRKAAIKARLTAKSVAPPC
jgi:hypothetical protein